MLEIVVGLEEGISCKELDEYTTNAPYIARKRPSKTENDFRSSVVTGRDDGRMILILECGRSKVDQTYFCI